MKQATIQNGKPDSVAGKTSVAEMIELYQITYFVSRIQRATEIAITCVVS